MVHHGREVKATEAAGHSIMTIRKHGDDCTQSRSQLGNGNAHSGCLSVNIIKTIPLEMPISQVMLDSVKLTMLTITVSYTQMSLAFLYETGGPTHHHSGLLETISV